MLYAADGAVDTARCWYGWLCAGAPTYPGSGFLCGAWAGFMMAADISVVSDSCSERAIVAATSRGGVVFHSLFTS
jgi:hypothetical protein